jgi:hypothetical protein
MLRPIIVKHAGRDADARQDLAADEMLPLLATFLPVAFVDAAGFDVRPAFQFVVPAGLGPAPE